MRGSRRTSTAAVAAALTVGTLAVLLTACGATGGTGTPTAGPAGTGSVPSSGSPEGVTVPTGASLGLVFTPSEGSRTEVFPGLTLTLPATAREESGYQAQGTAPGRAFRLGAAGQNLPAVEVVSLGAGAGSLSSVSWTNEKLMAADPAVTNLRRAVETWPGASEAVAMSWTQKVGEGVDASTLDAVMMWVRAESGDAFRVAAYVPTGTLDGSDALATVLTTELGSAVAG